MGILNVTPDSFSDGGRYFNVEDAVKHGMQMVEDGADFIDVGGESTRPGSESIPVELELQRVIPVIERLAKLTTTPISIDTYKSSVADRALDAGAVIVNDISGLHFDSQLVHVVAKHHASLVIMHMKGMPKTMQEDPKYTNVIEEICKYLSDGIQAAEANNIQQIFVDPGLGFGKQAFHNIEIIRQLDEFRRFGYPIVVGPSRKSFLGMILDLPADERIEGTAAAVAVSIMNGANVVRVHDVKYMRRVAKVVDALLHG